MMFPTRTTILRLAGGGLFVHSPTELTPELAAVVRELDRVRWIVGPNRIHWWVPDWQAAFPDTTVWLAPGIADQAQCGGSRARTGRSTARPAIREPQRVIFAHGRWFDDDGAARMRASYAWLSGQPPGPGPHT